jgi:hypothetical protein
MEWQDLVLGAGSVVFSIALIPSLLGREKPALGTSVLTGSALTAFIAVYASLSLWFSTVTTAVTALCWWTLAYQKVRQGRD